MTPDQYVDTYHTLRVSDERMKLDVTLKLSKYEAGWTETSQTEATAVLHQVALNCCKLKRGNKDLPPTFNIQYDTRVDPTEEFYCAGIRRAFASRGSPAEISDALRLAILAKRTTLAAAADYGVKWFGQDCNSFAANYLGISPMIGIRRYALGSTLEDGQSKDLAACQHLLPLKPREDPFKVAVGDVLISYGPEHKTKGRWRHIALVQGLMVSGTKRAEGKAEVRDGRIGITEWGGDGQANHKTPNASIKIVTDVLQWSPPSHQPGYTAVRDALAKELPGRKLVGFPGEFLKQPAIRLFFDASPLDYIDHRGWHIAGRHLGY